MGGRDLRDAIRGELRLRDRLAQAVPLGDPAHCILLDLAVAYIEGGRVSITSACIASRAPATTALRYIDLLVDAGLAERQPDPRDGRRTWLVITDEGFASVEALFDAPAPAMFLKSARPLSAEGGRSNTPGAAADHSGKEISPFVPAGTPGSVSCHATDIAGFSTVGKRDSGSEPFRHTIHGRGE